MSRGARARDGASGAGEPPVLGRLALEADLAAGLAARVAPAGAGVEARGARAGRRGEPEAREAARPQPVDHRIVQAPPQPAAFPLRLDEERPDVAVDRVADGEADDAPVG